MGLRLTLRESGASGQQETRALTSGTLSFGRGAGNDWVLPDPERIISKTHCIVSVENGRYVLTDVSANGVFMNGARQATARDSRVVLTDGDEFRFGNYIVSVAEFDENEPRALGPRPGPGRFEETAIFGPGGAEGTNPLDIDPLEDPLGRSPDTAFNHPITAPTPPGRRGEDPFDRDDDRRRPGNPEDSLFPGLSRYEDWKGPSQPDHADAPVHAFTPPKALYPTDPNEIDFDALIGDLALTLPRPLRRRSRLQRQRPPYPRPRLPRYQRRLRKRGKSRAATCGRRSKRFWRGPESPAAR